MNLRTVSQWELRSALLGLGLLVISVGVVLAVTASQTVVTAADQDLTRYWRTTYDILVRPRGTRSLIEEKYGLVETNHLSGIWGGITFEQYKTIKAIPGVEIAAPIAMLGYIPQIVRTDSLGTLSEPGAYMVATTITIDNGARLYHQVNTEYYYINPTAGSISYIRPDVEDYPFINPIMREVTGWWHMSFLLAGIDPPQEAALVGLDQAVMEGKYLTGEELLAPRPYPFAGESSGPQTLISVPALINAATYVSMTVRAELKRLALPPEISDLNTLLAHGGKRYLATLPGQTLAVQEFRGNDAYQRLLESVQKLDIIGTGMESAPGAIIYREIDPPFPADKPVLEIVLPEQTTLIHGEPAYRTYLSPEETRFNAAWELSIKSVFNMEHIPKPEDVNRVPLETYFLPLATLRYDEAGRPVEPCTLRPTLNPAGYIQPPPLILTTLEAAKALRGNACISAIRVRVGGIDQLTPQAQRKIEAVASEIHRKTGLDVDIMVGSSPRRVLVHVPGIGYVEEQWVQKNVTLSYRRRIQSGHLLLIGALLVTGGLFAADMAWADLLARQRVLALQKALGWRSATLMAQVLRRALLTGLGAGFGGTALAVGALALARQPLPSLPWLLGIPLLVTGLSLLGSLYPARQAARVPPIPLLQMAGLRHRPGEARRRRGRSGGLLLPARYAFLGVARRWSRSILAGMTAALSAGLLVLLVGVVTDRAGYLSGTLLGEYILVQVEGYHWMLVGVGFGLAAAGMGNSLLAGVLERRREIGVLKALGWRTGAVARLFLLEGAVLGLLGGLAGTALGLSVYLALYRSIGVGLLGALAAGLGVPAAVGVLAAAYPARVAARVPPAEAVRGE